MTPDEVGSQAPAAVGGKSPRKPDNSWDSDGFSTNRDDFDLFGSENRKDSSYLDYSLTHANGETRGADELVGAGVGRSEASVGAQGSYERAGAFGGSDPSRVSHGADGFGSTADFGANAGHAGHGAHGVSNSADVGGGVGDASRGTYAAGTPTGQGGGHVGADTGTHGGSSTPAQGPHRADPGMPTGDTHGVSRADSTPGHGDTPRAGQGGDGRPGAPSSHDAHSTPKKETPAGDSLGGDKQPHSGKNAADTPATHADEAADTRKAGHGSGDAHGSGKADADAKQGHDSVERADADPTTKDHSANGKANDAADSTRHGDKTEADKPGPDAPEKLPYNEIAEDLRGEPTRPAKTTPEDPQTVDDYAKVLDNNYEANRAATAAPDALEKSPNDDMIEELSGETQPHGGKYAADTPATHVDEAADTTKAGHGSGDANGSGKVDADAKQGHDSVERADADPTTKDHSANGKADDAADSTRHGDKTEADKPEADKPTSDKSHKEDDAAHHDGDEHPKDTDDKHTTKADDADSKSTKDGDGKSDKDDADDDSNKDDTDSKSDKDEKYEDLYDHSHDKDGPDSSYNPETDPHSNPDPDYDSLPDPSIDQSEGFPEGVDPYRTPPKTRRQLEEALEAWESYQKKALPDDAAKWHSGRYGFDDVVNPERALGYNPDGSPRSMEDFMNVYYDKEKKQPVWPWDVEGLRKNGAKLNANYHEYTSITPFIKTHGEDLCRLGDPGGKFAAAVHKDGTLPSFGERGLFQPFSLGAPDMRARLTGELPEGHIVKYGEVAPAFGQPGGAIQLQIWGPDEKTGIIRELTLKEWKKRGIIEYVKHD